MQSKTRILFKTILGVISLFIYCEYLIYYVILMNCDWPILDPQQEDLTIVKSDELPVRAMVIADTHLLGKIKGHWFDKLRREWQMHRTFQTAIQLLKPELVFVLGDLTDEGLWVGETEFERYVKRFYDLFAVPESTKMYVALGNHDIGFHHEVTPYRTQRFQSAFNSTPIQFISVRGIHFVLINSMAMDGDGCFLCKPAEQELTKVENILKCARNQAHTNCDQSRKLNVYSKPILMQHYPLHRKSDMECDDFDSAPVHIKKQVFREKWECLSKEATYQLLKQIRPRLALSGHTHHGCTKKLPMGKGLEITIPSFSWRNKDNPTIGFGVFITNNYAFEKCSIPRESTVIGLYVVGITGLLTWSIYALKSSRVIKPREKGL